MIDLEQALATAHHYLDAILFPYESSQANCRLTTGRHDNRTNEFYLFKCWKLVGLAQCHRHLRHSFEPHYCWKEALASKDVVLDIRIVRRRKLGIHDEF